MDLCAKEIILSRAFPARARARYAKSFVFNGVFILEVDKATLNARLDSRPDDEWGKSKSQRALILWLHKTKEDIPSSGVTIDGTRPLEQVVDEILTRTQGEF